MSFSQVQYGTGFAFSGTSVQVTMSAPMTVGNTLILGVYYNDASALTISSVFDDGSGGSNTYTAGPSTISDSTGVALYTAPIVHAAQTIEVDVTGGSIAGSTLWAFEWSGIKTTSPVDGSNAAHTFGGGSSGETFNSGSFTTTTAGDLIFALGFCENGTALSPGTGFTAGTDDGGGMYSEYQTQSSAGAINPSMVTNGTGGFSLFLAAIGLKAPAGGGTNTLTGSSLTDAAPSVGAPAIAQFVAINIGNQVCDFGLNALHTDCDAIYLTSQQPSTYTEATSTFAIGVQSYTRGTVFGSPAAGSGGGRSVTAAAITMGSITANSSTVTHWAAVDTTTSRLLAFGPLSGSVAVTAGRSFSLGSIICHLPNK